MTPLCTQSQNFYASCLDDFHDTVRKRVFHTECGLALNNKSTFFSSKSVLLYTEEGPSFRVKTLCTKKPPVFLEDYGLSLRRESSENVCEKQFTLAKYSNSA